MEGESQFRLQDRTAVITGPINSVNQAIAYKFTQLGANVALVDRNIDKAQRFAQQLMDTREIHERFGRAVAIQADLSKIHHVQDAIGKAAEAFGTLDIYVDGLMSTEVYKFSDPKALDELDRMMDVNLRSPMMFTHGIMRFLSARKRGRVIYLMHDLARLGFINNGLMVATRTGLIHFSKTLAREVIDTNVTVNCVAIGLTEELVQAQHKTAANIQAAAEMMGQQYPGATLVEPERIANMVAFLASPMASAVTGQTIAVSQGLSFQG